MTPDEREQWHWHFDTQRYQHKPCDNANSDPDNRKCEKCAAPDPSHFTFGDVMAFVEEHKLDQDEYFVLDDRDKDGDRQVYTRGVRWVSTFWVEGGSEGWYVHVEQITSDGNRHLRMLGKFWSIDAAENATNMIARFLQSRIW
ncbi:MAG TPA: hypothetical protein VGK19_18115 [Capsulimonadaceae bacterium]|jgi:hypothetical protein